MNCARSFPARLQHFPWVTRGAYKLLKVGLFKLALRGARNTFKCRGPELGRTSIAITSFVSFYVFCTLYNIIVVILKVLKCLFPGQFLFSSRARLPYKLSWINQTFVSASPKTKAAPHFVYYSSPFTIYWFKAFKMWWIWGKTGQTGGNKPNKYLIYKLTVFVWLHGYPLTI